MKAKPFILICTISALFFTEAFGQVGINTGGSDPDASSMLDVTSTDKGMLIPRMTATQRNGISSAANGLLVYQIDESSGFYYYNGTAWTPLGSGDGYSGNVIDIDGRGYRTVKIGNQEWMAENLKVTHYSNGDYIPNVTGNTDWANLTTGARCYFNNDSTTNNPVYGALYNWYTVHDSRNLCPTGWHAPNDADWCILSTYLDPSANCSVDGEESAITGGKMKAAILWLPPNAGATNTTGFSGFSAGVRSSDGSFPGPFVGDAAHWWTATERYTSVAWIRYIYYASPQEVRTDYYEKHGLNVRCVRN